MSKTPSVTCADCGAPMILRKSRYGPFYGCSRYPGCDGTHGAHPNGKPLGTPGTAATRKARMDAHAAFDKFWKGGGMTRKAAYQWLRRAMGMSRKEAHIGRFNEQQCATLLAKIAEVRR